MLVTTFMKLASLLANPKAVSIERLPPPGIDQTLKELNDSSAPDVAAITAVPQAALKSYTKGGLVRGDVTVVIEGEIGPAAAAVGRRWICSISPSFT